MDVEEDLSVLIQGGVFLQINEDGSSEWMFESRDVSILREGRIREKSNQGSQ